jgi:hypothetical protein
MSKTLERRQRDASHRDLTRNRVLLLQEQRCPLQPVAVDRRALVLSEPFGWAHDRFLRNPGFRVFFLDNYIGISILGP